MGHELFHALEVLTIPDFATHYAAEVSRAGFGVENRFEGPAYLFGWKVTMDVAKQRGENSKAAPWPP